MLRTALLTAAISIVLATALAIFSAGKLVDHVERHSVRELVTLLNAEGESWATVRADGFQIIVGGLAENEAARYRTLQLISENINQGRVHDKTNVSQPDGLQPPKFALEILRNVERVSLIGLIPTATGRDYILDRVRVLSPDTQITDMLELTEFPEPEGWREAVDFALSRLKQVPRSKISVTSKRIKVTAVSDTPEEQQTLQISLAQNKPDALDLVLDISAPRPVITPFLFRLRVNNGQGELDVCSADTKFARIKIIRALKSVNLIDRVECKVGLGVPTTDWSTAVILSINAMVELGSGVVTLSDSDVSLIAADTVEQETFETAVARLENALPKLFSLQAILTPKPLIDGQTGEVILPDFTVTKSPEGLVQMRGKLPDQLRKDTVSAYAASLFGKANVYNQTRIVEGLPDGWTVRSMAGLEAMSNMRNGSLEVLPDMITIKGKSRQKDISSIVSRIFTTRIGSDAKFTIDVMFDENLIAKEPEVVELSDAECENRITAVLLANKINFAPSSASIAAGSLDVIKSIAEILAECPNTYFEIGGHTDSQGGEDSNAALSQSRADAVLSALLDRRVLTAKMKSNGYGETRPIADNGTEEGRAGNRRIEFRAIQENGEDGQE